MPLSLKWLHKASWQAQKLRRVASWQRSLATVVTHLPPQPQNEVIKLRQYQEECIQSVLSYLKNGQKRLGISLATGSGKTVIFTQLIDRIAAPNPKAKQTLILAHRRELVEQAARHCTRAYPDKNIEIEMGKQQASGLADITVASVRSLVSVDRLFKYNPDKFKLVLVDEAHHIVAPGYLEILHHFGLDKFQEQSPALVGVSATFSRFDGIRLGAVIDHIVYHKDYVDMIGERWLSDVMFTTVKSSADLSQVRSYSGGDFMIGSLSKAVNTDRTNEITVSSWQSEASDRKSTLVFCVDIDHVTSLTEKFRSYGIDARYITGTTKSNIRGARLEAFKHREFPVLINCGVFTEGTDIPNIDCVLLARPTKSRNLLVQMIGRGMRLYPGKESCHVIDMVASLETGIVTVPTLYGLDPGEIVSKASGRQLEKLKFEREADQANGANDHDSETRLADAVNTSSTADHSLSFTHYDSVHDLIEDTSGERHVRAISQNAWVQVDNNKYVLSAKGGVLTLERKKASDGNAAPEKNANVIEHDESDDSKDFNNPETSDKTGTTDVNTANFHVIWKYTLKTLERAKAPWSKPRTVATAVTLTDALHAADTFAATKFDRVFINTSSSWRKQPASEGQLVFLNKMRMESDDPREQLRAEDVNKGQANDMITKLKHGARGKMAKVIVQRRKTERESAREKSLREKEMVRVGPVAT